jgi:hypothetical protein
MKLPLLQLLLLVVFLLSLALTAASTSSSSSSHSPASTSSSSSSHSSASAVGRSEGPPAFFLSDPSDGACLSGATGAGTGAGAGAGTSAAFSRCGAHSLWAVTGRPGSYQLHRRPAGEEGEEGEGDQCLAK